MNTLSVIVGAAVVLLFFGLSEWRWRHRMKRLMKRSAERVQQATKEEKPPEPHETILPPEPPKPPKPPKPPERGACGIRGCPNQRPHSHVMDLARRVREKK